MKQTKHFKRTAFPLSAKSMVSLMLLLIAMLLPQGAWAISGSGTSSSPYLIANEADLRTFQQYVENGNSGIYGKLTADITLTSAWTRIGRADRKFTGYFDGQGHTISGMNLSFTAYEHGFFGFVNNATIKNFTLTGTMTSSANGNHSHGTVVGSAAGTTVIENVTSSVNLTLNHTGFTCIGGIVGHMDESSKVIGCTYTGTINLNKDSEQVGGIVGYAQRDLYITNNVFSGTITSTGTCKYLAGIAGKTDGTIEVSGCTNIGTINGGPSYDCVAGIVGYVQYQSQALITNCYFGGSLSSTSSGTSLVMGGILGAVNDDAGTNFRGLTYCFSDGTLTATNSSSTQIGGIAGVIKSKAVSKVLNNSYLSGTASQLAAITNNSSSFDSSNKAITISVTAGTGGTVKKSYVYPTSTTATQLQVVATPNSGYHYVKWSDNGVQTHNVSLANNVSLTATFGAHTYGDWTTDVAATCTSAGTHHRVCTYAGCGAREDGTIAALGHGSTGYNESYSWTGNAYNDASQDTKACTFTLTCKKCSTKVVNGASLTCIKTAHVDATCRATGSTTYQATGSYTAANSAYNYHATKTNEYKIDIIGHGSEGYIENYEWTGNAYNDISQDTKACTFTLTCKKCSAIVVNGKSLTCHETGHKNATCTENGSTNYQVYGSYTSTNGAYSYSVIKTNVYVIDALGHDYGDGVWLWNDDGKDASCTRTCSRNANHLAAKDVKLGDGITSELYIAPTCTTPGTTRYIATANVAGTEYSAIKDIVNIAPTGIHTFAANDNTQSECTVCHHGFFRYTSKGVVAPYNKNLKDASGNTLTVLSNICKDGKGVMEFNKPLVTIGEQAFRGRTGFTGDLTIPNTVTCIERIAFYQCSGFTGNLIIPNSVTSIGSSVFMECTNFKGLTIGNSVTSIGEDAFYKCSGFTGNLTIPNSVTSIGGDAFSGCIGFTGVEFQSVPQIEYLTFRNVNCPMTVVLSDDSYVYIGSNRNFPTVASVTAPCTLNLTGSVVAGHRNLTRTHECTVKSETETYLASAASCADATYYYKCAKCDEHGTKTWAKAGTGLGHDFHQVVDADYLVSAATCIADAVYHEKCSRCDTHGAEWTVTGTATGLHTFAANDLAQGHCTVCNHGFFRYTATAKVEPYTPENLKNAKGQGIYNKDKHTFNPVNHQGVMEFDEPLATIGNRVFYLCYSFTGTLTIPNSVTSIGEFAFYKCYNLDGNLIIPNSVTSIGEGAFADCVYFTGDLAIPNSVTSIENYAFQHCSGFTGVVLNSVPQIGVKETFNRVNCTKTVVLSDDSYVYTGSNPGFPTVASVKAPCTLDLTDSAVENHANLTINHGNIIVDAAVAPTCTTTGLTEGSHCDLCHTVFVAQETIPALGHHTFAASDLTHDVCTVCNHGFLHYEANSEQRPYWPDELQDKDDNPLDIVSSTFSNGQGVMEFNAPLVTIGQETFAYSTFTSVTIPNTVTTIGESAFYNSLRLQSVTIPQSVTTIGNEAFKDIKSDCNITLKSLPSMTYSDVFFYTYWYDDGTSENPEEPYVPEEPMPEEPMGDMNCVKRRVAQEERRIISPDIELDDNSFVSPDFSGNANSISYSRQMTNEWGTIVLPFAINYDADNTNYKLYQLTAASADNLTFTEYEDEAVIPASTPMVVKAIGERNGAGKYEITLTGAGTIRTAINPTAAVNGLSMNGTYTALSDQTNVYFIAQNKFWWAEAPISIAPFRAWFNGSAPSNVKALNILVEEADGIANISNANGMLNGKYMENGRVVIVKNGKKFNLNGQKIK